MNATHALHAIILREIETGHKEFAASYGYDWFNLTPEEEAVFELTLDDLPSLVAVWCAYEAVLGISNNLQIPDQIVSAFRAEHPWFAEHCGDRSEPPNIDSIEFAHFAKLFGVPYRLSSAWFQKKQFWLIRVGITRFVDEQPHGDQMD